MVTGNNFLSTSVHQNSPPKRRPAGRDGGGGTFSGKSCLSVKPTQSINKPRPMIATTALELFKTSSS